MRRCPLHPRATYQSFGLNSRLKSIALGEAFAAEVTVFSDAKSWPRFSYRKNERSMLQARRSPSSSRERVEPRGPPAHGLSDTERKV